jgi:tetratricopeptide (TPR) repeat protein
MAKGWARFPYPDKKYGHTAATLKKAWGRLHRATRSRCRRTRRSSRPGSPSTPATSAGGRARTLAAGGAGLTVANKATAIYANYLEENEKKKLALFEDVAARAEQQQAAEPKNANAFYWQAYALGRYAQGISIGKALAQGIGGKVKAALETAIKLAPKHADAHIALAAYHAEVIDKVGAMIGGLTYGAKKDTALKLYETALKLAPESAIARIEYANGLVMLEGKKALAKAEKLYAEAAACEPLDAMERLDVELAKTELED